MWLPSFWKDLTKSSGRCKTTPLEQCDRQLVSLASTKIHTKTCLKSLRTWRKLKKDKTLTTGIPYQWIIKHPLKCELLEDRDYFGSFFYFVFLYRRRYLTWWVVPLKDWMCVSNRTFYFLFIKQNKHLFFLENVLNNICSRKKESKELASLPPQTSLSQQTPSYWDADPEERF